MEALLAVGLAGNVVQFVQFAGKLISEADTIRKSGSPSSLPELKERSECLTKQAGVIKTSLEASARDTVLAQEDRYLLDVASDCQTAGTQFLTYLNTLVRKPASQNPFRSAQASVEFRLARRKIEDFASKLDKFRSALTLATTLALRVSTNDYSGKILAHLEALKRAGLTQGSDGADTLALVQSLVKTVQQQAGPRLDTIEEKIRGCLHEIEGLRKGFPQTRERAILTWLNFRQMTWRYEEVPYAYQKTFQWIFQKPSLDNRWDDFKSHLAGKDVIAPYFINGKAGSGKSTLMKFIVGHASTTEVLTKWAGVDELLVAKFFFWNLGTPLQKSNMGMLRALTYSVLERYPELIPAVFPSLYQNWKDSDVNSEPTYIEMKRAIELLKEKSSGFLKLCIFIDGIDEFEGDHKDISRFLRSLASPRVKLIVSSRPIPACLSALQGCPMLELQDLTRHDMEIFVQGELSSHQLMVGLERYHPRDAKILVTEIKDKAEGVFLWVKLVVRLLVDGLEAGDNMKDLLDKLHSLPSDLRGLYRRMFEKMQPEYQRQPAEIFQLYHTWNVLITDQLLRALVLSYAIQCFTDAFSLPVAPLEPETSNWLSQNVEARIRSRCCGLIELRKTTQGWRTVNGISGVSISVGENTDLVVSYLHRTVAEFLKSDDVWNEICTMTKDSDFNPVLSLASACLSMMKVASNFTDPALHLYLTYTTKFCRIATGISDQTLQQYVTTIDKTMNEHRNKKYVGQSMNLPDVNVHWSADLYHVRTDFSTQKRLRELASLDTFAARNGLVQYLKTSLKGHEASFLSRYAMVLHAIESWRVSGLSPQAPLIPQDVSLNDRAETLLFLLQHIVRPEDAELGDSLWDYAILLGHELLASHKLIDCAELMEKFLSTAQSPRALMDQPVQSNYIGKLGIEDRMTLIRAIQNAEGPEVRSLGVELGRLVSTNAPFSGVSDQFAERVSKTSIGGKQLRQNALDELELPGASALETPFMTLKRPIPDSFNDIPDRYDYPRGPRPTNHRVAQNDTLQAHPPPPMALSTFAISSVQVPGMVFPQLIQPSFPHYDPGLGYQAFNTQSAIPPGSGFFTPGGYGWQNVPATNGGLPQYQPFSTPRQPQVPMSASTFADPTFGKCSQGNHNKSKKPVRFRKPKKRNMRRPRLDPAGDNTSSLPG